MSDKEITRLLTLIDHRQRELTTACKEIANWIDRQGDTPVAGKIRDRLKAVETDEALVKKTLTSLKIERPLPRFR